MVYISFKAAGLNQFPLLIDQHHMGIGIDSVCFQKGMKGAYVADVELKPSGIGIYIGG